MKPIHRYLLLLLCVVPFSGIAQQPTLLYKQSNVDGLINNRILSIDQDPFGRLWIGTTNGVSCYDGKSYVNYNRNRIGNRHLSGNYAQSLLSLPNGDVWIATPDSLNIYNYQQDRMSVEGSARGLVDSDITQLRLSTDQSAVWVGTYGNGLYRYEIASDTFVKVEFSAVDQPKHVMCLFEDKNQFLWIGCRYEGFYKYDLINNQLYAIELPTRSTINTIHRDRVGILWIGCDEGLYAYTSGNMHAVSTPSNRRLGKVRSITEDRNGIIWVGSEHGLFGIDADSGNHGNDQFVVKTEISDSVNSGILSYNSISEIHTLDTDKLCIGTYGGGINIITTDTPSIHTIQPINSRRNEFAANKTTALCTDSIGNLYIGLDGRGIAILKNNEPIRLFDGAMLHDKNILSLCVDKKGGIWAGGYTNGLAYLPKNGSRFLRPNSSSNHGSIRHISINNDTLVVGSGTELFLYDLSTQKTLFSTLEQFGEDFDVRSVCCYQGEYWCGTYGAGLLIVNPKLRQYRKIATSEGLGSNIVYDVELRRDTLWCATDYGISYIDLKAETSLAETIVRNESFIAVDSSDETIWVSTIDNIYSIDKDRRKLNRMYVPSRQSAGDYAERALLHIGSSSILCGGFQGVNNLALTSSHRSYKTHKLIFTALHIFDTEIAPNDHSIKNNPLLKNINLQSDIKLAHKQNSIRLDFILPNYEPDYINYAYKLEEIDETWLNLGATPTITLHNLPTGTYKLTVKAYTEDDSKIDSRSLIITVLAPWWLSTFAKSIYFVLVVILLYFAWRIFSARLKLKHQVEIEKQERAKEIQINEAKLNFFTNISHELRTPLTLLLAPVGQLKQGETNQYKIKNLQLIERNANRLLSLVNQILDFKKSQDGAILLRVCKVDIQEHIRDIVLSFEELAKEKNLHFESSFCGDSSVVYVDPDVVDKIVMNLLSNAFKFTNTGGVVQLAISTFNDNLEIVVEDNGVGIDPKYQAKIFDMFYQVETGIQNTGSGIGLHLVKRITELHHGVIHLDSVQGQYTSISIQIPSIKDYYTQEELSPQEIEQKEYFIEESGTDEEYLSQLTISQKKQVVLIVEDNLDIRNYLAETLNNYYSTIAASNGQEAMDILKTNNVDLIATDVVMPVVNGIELTRNIKANFDTSHIPVVMLSAKSTIDDMMSGLVCGADAYITKPFTISHLIVHINKLLENRNILREKYQRVLNINFESQTKEDSSESLFMEKLTAYILENISDANLNGDILSREFRISRASLHRKLKAISSLSAGEFIRSVRLQKSAKDLSQTDKTISEISYDNGFNTPSYFSTCFTAYYSVTPKEYRQNNQTSKHDQ